MDYLLVPGWLAGDEEVQDALRKVITWEGDRATGWLCLPDRPPFTSWPEPFFRLGPGLLDDLHDELGVRFSAVCYQGYLNGSGCDWHNDYQWGAQAILSLGQTRLFGLRREHEETYIHLHHGDLLYMPQGFQSEWEHSVPIEETEGERCSLVFRSPA